MWQRKTPELEAQGFMGRGMGSRADFTPSSQGFDSPPLHLIIADS